MLVLSGASWTRAHVVGAYLPPEQKATPISVPSVSLRFVKVHGMPICATKRTLGIGKPHGRHGEGGLWIGNDRIEFWDTIYKFSTRSKDCMAARNQQLYG